MHLENRSIVSTMTQGNGSDGHLIYAIHQNEQRKSMHIHGLFRTQDRDAASSKNKPHADYLISQARG